MLMIAPQGQKVGPAGLEPPAGVRKRRKVTVRKRRNTAPEFKALDPKNVYIYFHFKKNDLPRKNFRHNLMVYKAFNKNYHELNIIRILF